jgi:hypothetical protein
MAGKAERINQMEIKFGKKTITAGKATKFKKVRFDMAKIIALYKSGKPVSQIAEALGFPKNCGQNRTRRILVQAGVYKKAAKKKAA